MADDGTAGNKDAAAAARRRRIDPEARRAALEALLQHRGPLGPAELDTLDWVFPDIQAALAPRIWAQVLRARVPDPEDAFQETVLALLRFLRGEIPESLRAIQHKITRGVLANCIRARKSNPATEPLPSSGSEPPPTTGKGVASAQERREITAWTLAELPGELREVVEAHYLDGLSESEAAFALDLPLGTYKTRLRRARAALTELGRRLRDSSGQRAA